MKRHELKTETLTEMLLRKLQKQTNDDGNFIYPGKENGKESIEERTGSNLIELIDYSFGHSNTGKPIDISLFYEFLTKVMFVPSNLLYYPPTVWKKLNK